MNGCQYAQKRFSAPASWNTTQIQWDLAFLTKPEFITKWGRERYESENASGSTKSDSAVADEAAV